MRSNTAKHFERHECGIPDFVFCWRRGLPPLERRLNRIPKIETEAMSFASHHALLLSEGADEAASVSTTGELSVGAIAASSAIDASTSVAVPTGTMSSTENPRGSSGGTGSLANGDVAGNLGYCGTPVTSVAISFLKRPPAASSARALA